MERALIGSNYLAAFIDDKKWHVDDSDNNNDCQRKSVDYNLFTCTSALVPLILRSGKVAENCDLFYFHFFIVVSEESSTRPNKGKVWAGDATHVKEYWFRNV